MRSRNNKVLAISVRCYYDTSVYFDGQSVQMFCWERSSCPTQAYCCFTFGNNTQSFRGTNHTSSYMYLLKNCSHYMDMKCKSAGDLEFYAKRIVTTGSKMRTTTFVDLITVRCLPSVLLCQSTHFRIITNFRSIDWQ
ncbi:uncharacterized protein LOC125501783 [Athalia rosae]|uniref:uncharacterized protein LOC125501783 n=1 Tax=Athalia rosae TaxID=37344 RepID=UPI0020345067|nr:uncharacterized protein LOC125501783 [Athalia rosae]